MKQNNLTWGQPEHNRSPVSPPVGLNTLNLYFLGLHANSDKFKYIYMGYNLAMHAMYKVKICDLKYEKYSGQKYWPEQDRSPVGPAGWVKYIKFILLVLHVISDNFKKTIRLYSYHACNYWGQKYVIFNFVKICWQMHWPEHRLSSGWDNKLFFQDFTSCMQLW